MVPLEMCFCANIVHCNTRVPRESAGLQLELSLSKQFQIDVDIAQRRTFEVGKRRAWIEGAAAEKRAAALCF